MELVLPGIGLIFWSTITFLIVLLLLRKFAWKPILDALHQREDFIDESLQAAETAKAEVANMKAENERLLDEARVERDRIIKEANEAGKRMIEDARAEATKQANRQVEEARQAIQTEKAAALADVKQKVAQMSLAIAEKLMRKELANEEAQKQLVQDYLQEVKVN